MPDNRLCNNSIRHAHRKPTKRVSSETEVEANRPDDDISDTVDARKTSSELSRLGFRWDGELHLLQGCFWADEQVEADETWDKGHQLIPIVEDVVVHVDEFDRNLAGDG
ncbi:unnamed protein product [Fusarium graminearum]|nr:unnamed protein product [Fusarium graminearum]